MGSSFLSRGDSLNDVAITKVLGYLDDFEDDFGDLFVNKAKFEERSFSRWAIFEILNLLMDRPFEPPESVIEDFIFQMTAFSYVNDDPRFTIAKNTAEDILGLFIFERGTQ